MRKQAVITFKLEPALRDQFMAEAEAAHQPVSQVVRELMRDFVDRQRAARDHDAWFRSEVEQAVREADDPNVQRTPNEDVEAKWRRQRAELVRLDRETPGAD